MTEAATRSTAEQIRILNGQLFAAPSLVAAVVMTQGVNEMPLGTKAQEWPLVRFSRSIGLLPKTTRITSTTSAASRSTARPTFSSWITTPVDMQGGSEGSRPIQPKTTRVLTIMRADEY